jgi:hypothetical protein
MRVRPVWYAGDGSRDSGFAIADPASQQGQGLCADPEPNGLSRATFGSRLRQQNLASAGKSQAGRVLASVIRWLLKRGASQPWPLSGASG